MGKNVNFIMIVLFSTFCDVYSRMYITEARKDNLAIPVKETQISSYEETIINVTDGVYVASGFSFSNMVMIEGTDGIIIVNALKNSEQALVAHAKLREITKKPLKAIILTQFHMENIGGVNALVEANNNSFVEVIAHRSMAFERTRYARLSQFNSRRTYQQFGANIISSTAKCMVEQRPCLDSATVTRYVDKFLILNLIGLRFEIYHTPGETGDHLAVWVPSKHVLMPGDNIYNAFPNLHSVRGTPSRNVVDWYNSLGLLRDFRSEYLLPSRSLPITGTEKIGSILTAYRDAIQFVHDQTVRMMNEGYETEDIIEQIKIPRHLASNEFLAETYGTVEWSVRGIIHSYVGWFDGYIQGLFPLSMSKEIYFWNEFLTGNYEGRGWVKMATRAKVGLHKSNHNLERNGSALVDELIWSLKLSLMATELSGSNKVIKLTGQIIEALSMAKFNNRIARNMYWYYINRCKMEKLYVSLNPILHLPIEEVFHIIPLKFKAEKCQPFMVMSLRLNLTDTSQPLNAFIIRNCIIERVISPNLAAYDMSLTTTEQVFRMLLSGKRYIVDVIITDEAVFDGTYENFNIFVGYIDN